MDESRTIVINKAKYSRRLYHLNAPFRGHLNAFCSPSFGWGRNDFLYNSPRFHVRTPSGSTPQLIPNLSLNVVPTCGITQSTGRVDSTYA